MKITRVYLGLLLGCCVTAPECPGGAADDVARLREHVSVHPDDLVARRDLGLAFVQLATEGSTGVAEEAIAQFDAVLAAHPEDMLAMVNRGLAIVLKARDAPLLQKRNMANRGFAQMDQAVAMAPQNPAVRLVRAINAYQMPRILGRAAIAREDFEWLLEAAAAGNVDLDPGLLGSLYFHAGSFALKDRDPAAVELLERALEIEAARPTADQIQTMLALARGKFRPHADAQSKDEAEAAPSGF